MDDILKNLKKEPLQGYYKTLSAINVLKNTPTVFEAYKVSDETKGDILLHMYGLLQNMFVSIDALYDLCKTQMHYKYSVNINQNEVLRKIKHIRNDIVGHPTHRTYQEGGIGYSVLNEEKTTLKDIYYETHFFLKNNHEIITNKVDTYALMDAFSLERDTILTEVKSHLLSKPKKTLTHLAFELANNARKYIYNLESIDHLRKEYMKTYAIKTHSNNRILWRLRLLEKCIHWHSDSKDENALIEYITFSESYKIYTMFAQLEQEPIKKIYMSIPKLLKQMYTYLNINKEKVRYTEFLNDASHFYFKKDLEALKGPKIITFLEKQTDPDYIYLIGKSIQNFKPKSK